MTYNVNNIRKVHLVPHYLWSTISWSELNLDESIAWGLIGYDMDKWDNNILKIQSYSEYNDIQQKAILDLGFKDYSWNARPVNPEFPTILLDDDDEEEISVDNIVEYWDVHNWDDLDQYQKELFSIVGFDEESFDYNIYPETNWQDFSEEQKDSLCFLGYTQPTWSEILYDQLDDNEEDDDNYEIEVVIELDYEEDTFEEDTSEEDETEDKLSIMEKGQLKEKKLDFMKVLKNYNSNEINLLINYYITLKNARLFSKQLSFTEFVERL